MFFADYRFLLCTLNTIHFFILVPVDIILMWRPALFVLNELFRLNFCPVNNQGNFWSNREYPQLDQGKGLQESGCSHCHLARKW